MALYLDCEVCIRNWGEYAAAMRVLRRRELKPKTPIVPVDIEGILRKIRAHEVLWHGRKEEKT